ncbi:MAG: zinc ABC transporter solute-binding protein [Rhodobacteraceae bacterium]|nr:zinc ABC transporter solute-binding protein [Paracoccaceae bacterium]
MKLTLFLSAIIFLANAFAVVAKPLRVVTDIPPVHSLTAMVMQGVGTPDLLLSGQIAPHDFALRPSQASALSRADLVIWVGPDLSPSLGRAIGTLAEKSTVVSLQSGAGLTLLPFRETGNFGGHGHSETEPETIDPHIWLNPDNAALWLDHIAAKLAERDPDNAETYRANATGGKLILAELAARIETLLEPVQNVPFLVFHDAYHYFEDRFGIEAVAAVSGGHAAPPGVAHIHELRAVISDMGAICLFSEPQFESKLLDRLTEGTALKTGTLDPIGATLAPGRDLYPALMLNLATSLAECLN